jgi:SAM-dependent methyltransferase
MTARPETTSAPVGLGCDLCGATTTRGLYTTRDRLHHSDQSFIIAACDGCGVLRTLPEMTERELAAYYPQDYWGEANEPTPAWIRSSQSDKTEFLAACALTSGRILDVGCGSGWFLRTLDGNRWERFGVETGAAAAQTARRALGNEQIFTGPLLAAAHPDASFDVVAFWSALEHMNNPRANIIQARRKLRPGGTLIVQVPNAASYQARWFEGNWFALDAPRHRYHFTLATLDRLLSGSGFNIYRTTFHSKAHNAHALRQSLKSKLYTADSPLAQRALFLAAIPFLKPFDWLMSTRGQGATLTIAARAV